MAFLWDGLKLHSHRFGLHRFGQGTLLGMYRWLILSLIAYLIADWTYLLTQLPNLPDWGEAAQKARESLFPKIVVSQMLLDIERLTPLARSCGFDINFSRCKIWGMDIDATGIFYLKPLNREELSRQLRRSDRTSLDPTRLQTNDITAISQDNPKLNGRVFINTPDIDPSRGLIRLPTGVVDASTRIASNCGAFLGKKGSSFLITKRGGLPPGFSQQ